MAIDFPSAGLTVGQIFTSGGASWKWDGTKWVSNAASDGYLPLTGGTINGSPGSLVIGVPPGSAPSRGSLIANANTAAPIAPSFAGTTGLQVIGADGQFAALEVTALNTAFAVLRSANGTLAAPTATVIANTIGGIAVRGYGTSAWATTSGGAINFSATENWTNTAHGTDIAFYTTPNGAAVPVNQMLLSQGLTLGNAGVNGADNGRGSLIANANTTAPIAPILASTGAQIIGSDGNAAGAEIVGYGAGPGLVFRRANGTPSTTLTAITSGQLIASLQFRAYGATVWGANPGVTINCPAAETWSDTAHGTSFTVSTTPTGTAAAVVNLTLDGSGNLTIVGGTATKAGGGSWVAPSDPALKSDVTPYTDGLDALLQLEPIRYAYNGRAGTPDDGRQYVGLDAEAAAAAMPSLVGEMTYQPHAPNEEGEPVPEGMPETYKTVDPSELIYTLVNAVKELSARLAVAEAKLA